MRVTNALFTKDELFIGACACANTSPTTRQASKYRRGLGIAVPFKQRALAMANQKRIEREDEREESKDLA